jgi:hypothetical protein
MKIMITREPGLSQSPCGRQKNVFLQTREFTGEYDAGMTKLRRKSDHIQIIAVYSDLLRDALFLGQFGPFTGCGGAYVQVRDEDQSFLESVFQCESMKK